MELSIAEACPVQRTGQLAWARPIRGRAGRERTGWERWLWVLLFILLPSFGCKSSGFSPGARAPGLDLPGLQGGHVDLADLRGKVVLLNFWTTWCQPCVDEMPSLERLHKAYEGKGLVVLGVAVQDADSRLKELVGSLGLTFPMVFDRHGEAQQQYKVSGFPESFLVDRSGNLKMIIDPEGGEPVVRIVGPRAWDSPAMRHVIEGLLGS